MRYAVADIAVPLDIVSQMCDAGATVVFNARGGYVILERTLGSTLNVKVTLLCENPGSDVGVARCREITNKG